MADPQPPSESGWAGALGRVLSWLDVPWKSVVALIAVTMGGLGFFVWDQRAALVEAWMTPDAPALRTAAVPEALAKLATETGADLIQIWAVDLASNSQWFIGARRHDGERPPIPSPRRLPILVHASDVRRLVDVLAGQPVCVDLAPDGTPVVRRLVERGMKRGCAIPIPPTTDAFVGAIYLSWATPPDPSTESVAVGAAREIARKLAQ